MGKLSNIKPVEVKVRIEDYVHLLLGEKKTGKTTAFRDLINLYYKGDMSKGFLAGFEHGFNALDGLHAEKIVDWEDWDEYVDDFCDNKKSLSYEFIAIDTIDYFVDMAIDKTLRESKRKDGKKVTSINEAFAGYGRGKEYCIGIMRNTLVKLKNQGYGLFFIGHTKLKKKNTGVVLGDGQEYMQLSCNLTNDYAGLFEDMADMITYLVVEKEVNLNIEDAKKRTAKDKVNMHFRSNGEIDCGGRFKDLPDKLPYSVENYLKAFEQGVKASILKPTSDVDIEKMAKKQKKESDAKAENTSKKLTIQDMIDKVKKEYGNLGDGAKITLQQLVEDASISSLDELNESHRAIAEKMYDLVS